MAPTTPDPRSDAELVAAYARGDVRAFESLYHRHKRAVFRFARRFTGDDALADDVVQETFRAVVDRAANLRVHDSLTGWLYVVAKRAALKAHDRAARHQGDPHDIARAADATRHGAIDETAGDVERRVASLPESQREVVLLRFVDDWSLEAIATALELPLGTVKSRLHNALRALREESAENVDPE